MLKFWQTHAPMWAPEEEGGGGGASDDGAASNTEENEGEGEGVVGSSILDFADKTSGEDGDDSTDEPWTPPDDMKIPEHLLGTSAETTLSKVLKAYAGSRKAIAKGETQGDEGGEVSESLDGYAQEFETSGDDDAIAADLNSEESKPIIDAFREAGHDLKIPDKTFAAFMRKGVELATERGIMLGSSPEEAAQVSGEAEMAELTRQVGGREAQAMVNSNAAFGEKLVRQKILTDEADVAEFAQMIGTARASRIFHRMLTVTMGEKPIPPGDAAAGEMTSEEATQAYSVALGMADGVERDQAITKAYKGLEKFGGQSGAGKVRSGVLD